MIQRIEAEASERDRRFDALEKLAATISAGVDAQQAEIERLRDLVRHCWVHSGYRDCGYGQMTTEQKALYRAVIGRTEPDR